MAGLGGSCSAAWTGRHRRAWSAEWQSPGSLSLPGSRAAPWLSGGVSNFSLCLFSAPQLHIQPSVLLPVLIFCWVIVG